MLAEDASAAIGASGALPNADDPAAAASQQLVAWGYDASRLSSADTGYFYAMSDEARARDLPEDDGRVPRGLADEWRLTRVRQLMVRPQVRR